MKTQQQNKGSIIRLNHYNIHNNFFSLKIYILLNFNPKQFHFSEQFLENRKINMWAIFQRNDPQNFYIKNSFKENFLSQQVNRMQQMQNQALSIQQHLFYTLRKNCSVKQESTQKKKGEKQQVNMIANIRSEITKLSNELQADNHQYEVSVQYRDLQKVNDHAFFKNAMKNYDDKRKALKQYIYNLEAKVQEIESIQSHKTFRTYRQDQNIVVNSQNKNKILPITYITRQQYEQSVRLQEILKKYFKQRFSKMEAHHILSMRQYIKKFKYEACESDEFSASINLLQLIFFKEVANKKILQNRLKQIKRNFSRLDACNKLVKAAIDNKQRTIEFVNRQTAVSKPYNTVSKIAYEKYLKSLNENMQNRFSQGINFTKPKRFRSKSWNNVVQLQTKNTKMFNDMISQGSSIEKSDAGDLTKSFLFQLQRVGIGIHSKKIVEKYGNGLQNDRIR